MGLYFVCVIYFRFLYLVMSMFLLVYMVVVRVVCFLVGVIFVLWRGWGEFGLVGGFVLCGFVFWFILFDFGFGGVD